MDSEPLSSLPNAGSQPIWVPSPQSFEPTQLYDFLQFCSGSGPHPAYDGSVIPAYSIIDAPPLSPQRLGSAAYADYHSSSTRDFRRFWQRFLQWANIPWDGDATTVCRGDEIEHATFFPDIRLNYAEILLAEIPGAPLDFPALVTHRPGGVSRGLTRGDLRRRVTAGALVLQQAGIGAESRVAVVGRNEEDTVVAVLAAAAVGATIATAAPEVGAEALLAQLGQVEPTALLCPFDAPFAAAREQLHERIVSLATRLPSLRLVLALDGGEVPDGLDLPVTRFSQELEAQDPDAFVWPRFGFNHPLFVLSTSGTTGRPKCIVHGAGGTVIEHIKEHRLHCDLRLGDKLFFQTSPAWMMWHWQLSALASGVEIVLNAAPVSGPDALWKIVAEQDVTVFGTTPAYFQLCEALDYDPSRHFDFPCLRAVLSTGSILYPRQQEWMSRHVRQLPIQSISGGSDIIGCFVLGCPMVPAYAAECMARGLGLDVRALAQPDSDLPPRAGELICAAPFPSRPLGFLADPGGLRFHDAYFAKNPGVWTHGDLIEFTPHGSARMLGRSDSVMNIRGIRIGPADIYRAISDMPEIHAAVAVEKRVEHVPGNGVIVLAVVLADGVTANQELFSRIARMIGRRTTPAHVPSIIVDVPELPTTNSGKLSERSVQDVVNGRPAANIASLRNPHCLEAIARHAALRASEANDPGPAADGAKRGLAETVRAIWETVLDRRPIGPHDDFFDLGGDSLAVMMLVAQVEAALDVALPVTVIYETPTVAAMVAFLEAGAPSRFDPLVRIRRGDARGPLFLIHGVGGNVMELVPLARRIEHGGDVTAVQARGLNGDGKPNARVEDMARDYVAGIRAAYPHGPYHLVGYSFGGLVAFEMARQLRGLGEAVGYVAIMDSTLHERHWPKRVWAEMLTRRLRRHLRELRAVPRAEWGSYAGKRLGSLAKHLSQRFGAVSHEDSFYLVEGLPPALREVREAALTAFAHFRPGTYDGTITLLRARDENVTRYDPAVTWRAHARRLTIVDVPGDHAGMVQPPVLDIVARHISSGLAAGLPPQEAAPADGIPARRKLTDAGRP